MSKNVDLIPNIKFPLGKSSRMLDVIHTWARVFTAAPFSKPKGGNHHSGYSLPADKWTNRCGPTTSWDVILPQGRERHSHRLQCGRALETRDQRAQATGRVEAVRAGGRWPLRAHGSFWGRGRGAVWDQMTVVGAQHHAESRCVTHSEAVNCVSSKCNLNQDWREQFSEALSQKAHKEL